MSSRPARRGAALLATALVVAGCGSGDSGDSGTQGDGSPAGASEAFPVTVSTAFGDVTVEEEPARVVALGWSDAETALALGVQPVGASDWLGVGGDGLGDWVEAGYDEAPEIIGTMEPSYEAIAALEPDLILDTRSAGTEERYELLSAIAPTIGQPEGVGPYQTTWQQQLEMVGQALGRAEQAEELAAEVEQAFTDAAEAHPEFEGTEVAVGAYTSEGFGAYVRGDSRVAFMEQLGFRNKEAIQDLATENFFVPVSEEQVSLLDADLSVVFPIFVDASEITSNPLWQTLPSVQAGHAVVLDDETVLNAFSSASAPGLLYALETAVPLFADAM
jgi:ABC-type Fe3+-hydroxamate transport system substrate-binding protein